MCTEIPRAAESKCRKQTAMIACVRGSRVQFNLFVVVQACCYMVLACMGCTWVKWFWSPKRLLKSPKETADVQGMDVQMFAVCLTSRIPPDTAYFHQPIFLKSQFP